MGYFVLGVLYLSEVQGALYLLLNIALILMFKTWRLKK